MPDLRAKVGVDFTFRWEAPAFLTGAPTLEVFHPDAPGGSYAPALRAVRASVRVNAVASDLRTLTATAPLAGALEGVTMSGGAAFLQTDHDGTFPVLVSHVSGSTVRLAEALPKAITPAGELQWASYEATLAAASVTARALRSLRWVVSYEASPGGDVSAAAESDEGLLHVVTQPFSTGLTHRRLVELFPALAGRLRRREEHFGAQIAAAEDELVERIRVLLRPRDLYEDDIVGAHALRTAHATYALAVLADDEDPARAKEHRDRAWLAMKNVLDRVLLEVDSQRDAPTATVASVTGPGTDLRWSGRDAEATGEPATHRRFALGQPH